MKRKVINKMLVASGLLVLFHSTKGEAEEHDDGRKTSNKKTGSNK